MPCGGLSSIESRPCPHAAVATAAAWTWGGVWTASTIGLVGLATRFAEIFRDFGVSLPWPTRAALNAAFWLRQSPLAWAISLLVLGGLIFACLAAGRARSSRPALALLWLGVAAGPALLIAGIVSFMLPLSAMIRQLNGAP